MPVNMGKMKKGYEKNQRGGDFWTPEVGDTLVLIHGPCREDDKYEPTEGLNYVEVAVHYGLGKNNSMVVSLDPAANPIIEHPFVKRFLKKAKIKLTGECPVAKAMEDGTLTDDEADNSRRQTRFLWGLTPLKHRSKKGADWTKMPGQPSVAMVGKTIYDGIMELFMELGDISDLDSAILVQISRKGKNKNDTKYKVSADMKTVKKPLKVPSSLRKKIVEAMKEGGDCDLFKVVANMMKSPDEIESILGGVVTTDEDSDDDDLDDDEGDLDGDEDEEEEGEDEEEEGEDEDGEDEDGEDEDGEEDEEGDDEDDLDGEDEEEEEEGEEEEGEEEEEEEEEEDPPPPPKKSKAKVKKGKAKAKATGDDDEDDLGLDGLDDEIDRVSKKKPKKSKKAKK